MMKRILLVLSVAALMAMMLVAMGAGSALAKESAHCGVPQPRNQGGVEQVCAGGSGGTSGGGGGQTTTFPGEPSFTLTTGGSGAPGGGSGGANCNTTGSCVHGKNA